jgi:hypothetical protein
MVFSSLVLWAGCPGAQAGYQMPDRIRHDDRAGRPKSLPTKNPPAQPSGFENFFSALAVFIKRPQVED